jgi:biotin-dependent carboxylase-like uncharacterized protein
MAFVRVLTPGMLTTVQDRGRWGWQRWGVPVAGPMDLCAHRLANAIVGNDPTASTLEITLSGPELEFEDERIGAVTGAEFDLTVDDRPQPLNSPFVVPSGSSVRFVGRRRGARAYLAIGGGLAVEPILNSRATHLPSRMGGFDGRALRAGDRIPLGPRGQQLLRRASTVSFPLPEGNATVRVVPGPDLDRFAADALDAFQSDPYVVDSRSNRMGFHLKGRAVPRTGDVEMLSDATCCGAVQVPAAGRPILLMADRPTAGGYPIIATVVGADLRLAAQLAPGDSISFVATTLREAMAALIAQEQVLMAFESGER